jgi:hypothetical protein
VETWENVRSSGWVFIAVEFDKLLIDVFKLNEIDD